MASTDPTAAPLLLPSNYPFKNKRCGRCGGMLIFEKHRRTAMEPGHADVTCVNCSHTAGTWVEGDPTWTVRLQPR